MKTFISLSQFEFRFKRYPSISMPFVDYSYENLKTCNKIILLLGVAMTRPSATLEPEKERFSVVSLLPFPLLPASIFILTYLQNQYKYLQKVFTNIILGFGNMCEMTSWEIRIFSSFCCKYKKLWLINNEVSVHYLWLH